MRSLKNITIPYFNIGAKISWLLVFGSCLSPIEIPTEKTGGKLVVSGQISPLQDQNIVQLGLTADTERLPFPISGATVTVFDENGGSYSYTEDTFTPGNYILTGGLGSPNKTYHVQIITPEGEVYESVPEKMPEAAGEITTSYEIVFEQFTDFEGTVSNRPFIKIYSNTTLPSTEKPLYLKWGADENFLLSPTDFPDPFGVIPPPCFIAQNADPQRVPLFNGADLKTKTINSLLVVSREVDWTFLERHYFTINQSSLTREAFEYWRKVNVVSNQVGSIFDTPPAEVTGNIFNVNNSSEKVYGYFQATNQTFDRFFIIPFYLPFPLYPECLYNPVKFQYEQRCLNCLSVRNSSYRRPDWF